MATVTMPSLFHEVTGGARQAEVPGTSLAEVVVALDALYPGVQAWIRKDDNLSPLLAVTVDGKIAAQGLATPVQAHSDIKIMPMMSGG